MHKLHLFCCTALCLLCLYVSNSEAQNKPWEFTLPFEQATIHYTLTGTEKGTETLYVKDNGAFRAVHNTTTSSMMGMTTTSQSIEITTPEWIISYDLTEGEADKVKNPKLIYQQAYEQLSKEEKKNFDANIKQVGPSLMINLNGTTEKNAEKILGYSCDKVTIESMSTTYLLHGTDIVMRSSTSIMGMNTAVEATSIDTKNIPPEEVFSGPKDIQVTHNTQEESIMEQAIHSIVDTLKQPDGAEKLQSNPASMIPTGLIPPSGEKESDEPSLEEIEQGMNMLKEMLSK
ncbi:hypothetical protein [Desulfogranum japonicum]|uniref:hypothetical protein n=1 Tax=Desulfogranum japonicum TaxID=231447 RepID=UPI0004159874|nr:hypothetical protein [Desulfogranum japonicum]